MVYSSTVPAFMSLGNHPSPVCLQIERMSIEIPTAQIARVHSPSSKSRKRLLLRQSDMFSWPWQFIPQQLSTSVAVSMLGSYAPREASGGTDRKENYFPAIPLALAPDVFMCNHSPMLAKEPTRLKCVVYQCVSEHMPYAEGWEWQKQALERRAAHPEDASLPDTVLIAQHSPVYTLGTGSTLDNLKFSLEEAPFDVVRTERGGEVTYHGPGQIVMYPIMNLRNYKQDIHWYLRRLEETVIVTLKKLGLQGRRIDGLTGVWVDGCKVAAVGVRVKRWITMHGLSLNVCPELEHFRPIVPCGIENRPVGSLESLCNRGEDLSMERIANLLVESFEEVFHVDVITSEPFAPP